ncbi:MAG: hypothetical protein MJZ19_03500 [Paludibacteraceae bacterium]|nr:hypothetical protein [Paludibacteraceae bacterium]
MKRAVLYILSILGTTSSFAQTDSTSTKNDTIIRRDIEVTKEYTPVIKEAGKINSMPEIKDVKTKKLEVNYREGTSTFKPKSNIIPTLDYATSNQEKNDYSKKGYVKVGGGNKASFLGELYTPIYSSDVTLLDFKLKHNSSFGKVNFFKESYPELSTDFKTKGLINDNRMRLSYLRSIKKKEIGGYGEFGFNRFNYYGLNGDLINFSALNEGRKDLVYENDDNKAHHITAGFNFRYKTKDFINKWKYDFQTNYKLLKTNLDFAENTIYTDLNGACKINDSHINLQFEMYNIFNKLPNDSTELGFKKNNNFGNYTVLKFNPYYTFTSEVGNFNLGLKTAFGIKQGRKFSITPDIFGNVNIIDEIWYLYAGVTGDYKVNNLRSVVDENLYIEPTVRPEDTYTPVDVYVGTKFNIFRAVSADFHVGYKVVNNPYFFVNKTVSIDSLTSYNANTFDVVYDDNAGNFSFGTGINYNWKNTLDVSLKFDYNKWILDKQEEAWQLPSTLIETNVAYIATDYLRFNVFYNFTGGRKALVNGKVIEMKNINDVGLGATYKVMSFLDAFVKFDNILNQKYENWYGYPTHRFNFMAGLTLLF